MKPGAPTVDRQQEALVREIVQDLTIPEHREAALLELSKKREAFSDLAPILWYGQGTIAALLQEIISIYPLLSPPALSAHASNRVCNALALLQCVASTSSRALTSSPPTSRSFYTRS
jgi:CCR4-NOT transcription complex subunit 9